MEYLLVGAFVLLGAYHLFFSPKAEVRRLSNSIGRFDIEIGKWAAKNSRIGNSAVRALTERRDRKARLLNALLADKFDKDDEFAIEHRYPL